MKDYSNLSDQEVLTHLQAEYKKQRDSDYEIQSLYGELYRRYYLRSVCLAKYYGLSNSDAEDAVQEALVDLYKGINSYNPSRPFRPWFFTIVMNNVRKKYREIKKQTYKPLEDFENHPQSTENNSIEKLHFEQHLRNITYRLPEKLRDVVTLKIYGELTHDEISKTLQIKSRQVYNRLNEAYELLKDYIKEDGL